MISKDATDRCHFCGRRFSITTVFEGTPSEIEGEISMEVVVECDCGATFVGSRVIHDADEADPF